jgi:diguanylate cyclase
MSRQSEKLTSHKFLYLTLSFCAIAFLLLALVLALYTADNLNSFSEAVVSLEDGWTLTADIGKPQEVSLPLTVPYGVNGEYTLRRVLSEESGVLSTPALCFYSNYVDIAIFLDDEELYSFASTTSAFLGSTGNTYHFVRMPADFNGKTLTVKLRGQLSSSITYLIKAPLLGSKATMLRNTVFESLPSIILAGCMLIIGIGLAFMDAAFRKRLSLGVSAAYASVFAILFGIYVFCETSFAQVMCPNGFALSSATLTLLALIPIPLIGLLGAEATSRPHIIPFVFMLICAVNFTVQTLLNALGLVSLRSMIPFTHGIIISAILAMSVCIIVSARKNRHVPVSLLAALPMIAGGFADILLIIFEIPSFNNSFWFSMGVSAFVIIEFCGYIKSFFRLYRSSLEASLLRDMAYRDALTGIGNRNAYEKSLAEIEESGDKDGICAIVLDINDLKLINDTYGHTAGDTAIQETGRMLSELAPEPSMCFRTGGDEFVVLLKGYNDIKTRELAGRLALEAKERGRRLAMPLSFASGFGSYSDEDGSFLEFIKRVDTLMYCSKRDLKLSRGCANAAG